MPSGSPTRSTEGGNGREGQPAPPSDFPAIRENHGKKFLLVSSHHKKSRVVIGLGGDARAKPKTWQGTRRERVHPTFVILVSIIKLTLSYQFRYMGSNFAAASGWHWRPAPRRATAQGRRLTACAHERFRVRRRDRLRGHWQPRRDPTRDRCLPVLKDRGVAVDRMTNLVTSLVPG